MSSSSLDFTKGASASTDIYDVRKLDTKASEAWGHLKLLAK